MRTACNVPAHGARKGVKHEQFVINTDEQLVANPCEASAWVIERPHSLLWQCSVPFQGPGRNVEYEYVLVYSNEDLVAVDGK